MSAAPSPCISGCTVRGDHRTTCETRDAKVDPCKGCLPRDAEFGRLCGWCWQRLNADVVDTPALVRYLWALAHSGETATVELKIHGGDLSEQGVIHGAVDAFDGLHACLASWAHLILEEHPDGARMAGPDERGVRSTGWSPAKVLAIDELAEPYYVGPTVAGVREPEATSRLVRWLLPMLPWCAQQVWAAEMRREVADVVRTTAARFPVTERTRAIPGVTCPVCERVSLVFDPPTVERHSAQVDCTTRGCGVVFTQEEFKRLTGIIEWEHREDQPA